MNGGTTVLDNSFDGMEWVLSISNAPPVEIMCERGHLPCSSDELYSTS